MSKDLDWAFLSAISDGLGPTGDIDGICAIISVFIMRRGYFPEMIHADSEDDHTDRARLRIDGEREITVWHHEGIYALYSGISTKSWNWFSEKPETRAMVFDPSEGYLDLFDFLDREFPWQKNEGEDYFSKLFSKGEALEIRKVEALENIAACLKALVPTKG